MRSEADVESVKGVFTETGGDPPAVNTAVRDTLNWVLGWVSIEELIEEYRVTGEDFHCFTARCGGRTGSDERWTATGSR